MEQNNEINKKDKSKIIILILSCTILALVAVLTIVCFKYKELSTKPNNNTVNNTENKDDNSNSENNNDTGNTENENNSNTNSDEPSVFTEKYDFMELECENSLLVVNPTPKYVVLDKKSGASTVFVTSFSKFGEFKVREDGKVELITELDIPSYIATKENGKYIMNLDNVKSVYSGEVYTSHSSDSEVIFVHKDGTLSILYYEGGIIEHPVFLMKNLKGVSNVDYISEVEVADSYDEGSTFTDIFAFDKSGKAIDFYLNYGYTCTRGT